MKSARGRHRLFFALRPDTETLEGVVSIQRRLEPGKGRAVPPQRLHATLLFMGNQSDDALRRLCGIASELDFPPCTLMLDRCGHFPRAGVLWLGPSRIPPELQTFQLRLSEAVASAGIGFDEKPWRMHLTLYRDLRRRPEKMEFEPVDWRLRDFRLMKSVQADNRLEYLCRGRWPA